jgi:hypothetical protein
LTITYSKLIKESHHCSSECSEQENIGKALQLLKWRGRRGKKTEHVSLSFDGRHSNFHMNDTAVWEIVPLSFQIAEEIFIACAGLVSP